MAAIQEATETRLDVTAHLRDPAALRTTVVQSEEIPRTAHRGQIHPAVIPRTVHREELLLTETLPTAHRGRILRMETHRVA